MTFPNEPFSQEEQDRRAYTAPAIVLELDLETRAGSVLPDTTDLLDLTGVGDSNYLP